MPGHPSFIIQNMGGAEPDLEALESRLTGRERMVIWCSPHNPGGRVWDREELVAAAAKLDSKTRLRPLYDAEHLAWQFGEMKRIDDLGEFTAHVVKTRDGSPVGWYVYYLKRGGVSRLFALEGHDKHLEGVTGHLLADADRRGAGAVMGRMEPKLRRVMAGRTDLIVPKGSLMMVHSRDPSLMSDALLGRLAFTRLQGENWYWWAIASQTPP